MMLVLSETPRPLVEHCAASVLERRELLVGLSGRLEHRQGEGAPTIG
jgi:hypothetical protein